MDKSYQFNRDILLSHIDQWKRQQKRDRHPSSDRALAQHVGVSHTYIQNLRRGHDGRRRVRRMNYATGLKFRDALDVPLTFLLPELLDAMSSDHRERAAA